MDIIQARPGWIEVIAGSMFSGKSEELIRRIRRATRQRTTVVGLRRGTYRFYTRDRDRAGNLERAPRRADARVAVR